MRHKVDENAYHLTKNCRGMKRCEHKIKTVSKSDAVNIAMDFGQI